MAKIMIDRVIRLHNFISMASSLDAKKVYSARRDALITFCRSRHLPLFYLIFLIDKL